MALVHVVWLLVCASALTAVASGLDETACRSNLGGIDPEALVSVKTVFEEELLRFRRLGETEDNPADSCQQIVELKPCHETGYYWIRSFNGTVKLFCNMGSHCGCSSTVGWTRVAHVNMRHSSALCPAGLEMVTTPKRLCGRKHDSGCSSAMFSTYGIEYSRVCGKVIGYQYATTNAFGCGKEICSGKPTIDESYVDGVSITYGDTTPRKHIWTFAAAFTEVPSREDTEWICPCTNTTVTFLGQVPAFVGSDYFCETGSHTHVTEQYYLDDPLWNGHGCGSASICCDKPGLPYFCKQLPQPTTDDIELRLCLDQDSENEDVLLEVIEINIQ